MVVAIDGPGGVGKSSVGAGVAARLGVDHLNSGALYRLAALAATRAGVALDDPAAVAAAVAASSFDVAGGRAYLDGDDVTTAIRGNEITAASSRIATMPEVRALATEAVRSWAQRHGGGVVEGRDIGTVVFPDAAAKVFLDASPEVRAARRAGDLEARGKAFAEIVAELERRDERDRNREVSPLRPAPDAVVIDTSHLTLDEVIDRVVEIVTEAGAG